MRAVALVAGALSLLVEGGVAGCADSSATASVPSDVTFSTQAPGVLQADAAAVLKRQPPDTATVEHGVVLAETATGTWYARVLIRGGIAVLQQGPCDSTWQDDDWWREQVVPGDVIEWSPKGNSVCGNQVSVTSVGGALAPTLLPTKG